MSNPSVIDELNNAYEDQKIKTALEIGLVPCKEEGGELEFLGSDYQHMELDRRMDEYKELMPF